MVRAYTGRDGGRCTPAIDTKNEISAQKTGMSHKEYSSLFSRVDDFTKQIGIRVPILLAPMAGACPPSLSIAVANAGGLGACGALMLSPDEIKRWASDFRAGSSGAFQINLWIPDPPPVRDSESEKRQREFLANWGPPVPPESGDATLPDFEAQCQALLDVSPNAVSSIMGLFPPAFVAELKSRGILWFANATTVAEAKAAEQAGADVIVAQGFEAGGHRGAFDPQQADALAVGLFALLPQVVDAVNIPVVATGGIADARGVAAALILGASAVQIGTGFLRASESGIHRAYADRLSRTEAHETILTRAFSGRLGRSVATDYVRASHAGPSAAPYPVQRGLTSAMREAARQEGDAERMQMWAGQSVRFARAEPAGTILREFWEDASSLLANCAKASVSAS